MCKHIRAAKRFNRSVTAIFQLQLHLLLILLLLLIGCRVSYCTSAGAAAAAALQHQGIMRLRLRMRSAVSIGRSARYSVGSVASRSGVTVTQNALTCRSFQSSTRRISSPRTYLTAFLINHEGASQPGQRQQSQQRQRPGCTQCWFSSTTTTSTTDESSTAENNISSAVSVSVDDNDHDNDNDEDFKMYKELQWLAQEIKRHDEVYYAADNDVDNDVDNDAGGDESSAIDRISDDDYDALAQREADLCRKYPRLLEQWENESGLGIAATRYGGRVGVADAEATTATATAKSKTATTAAAKSTVVDRVKRQHMRPMLSLDNVNNDEELLAWLERVRKKLVPSSRMDTDTDTDLDLGETDTESTVTVVTEPKLDGVSLSLHYERHASGANDGDGGTNNSNKYQYQYRLAWAATRGDGKKGQDVTAAVVDGMKLPASLSWDGKEGGDGPEAMEIRGEVVMPQTVFEAILSSASASGDNTNTNATTFSNARNAASGILLRKEQQVESVGNSTTAAVANEYSSMELRSKLRFYAYDMVTTDETVVMNGVESRAKLESLGFLVPNPIATTTLVINNETAWDVSDIPRMVAYHESLRLHRESSNHQSTLEWGDYDMDGCVHKLSEQTVRKTLGASNRSPRWAIAHKFPPLSAVTTLLGIDVQVGRTGALTPVAILEPVDLRGVTVQRATLHNFIHMRQVLGGVDRIPRGSTVLVRRAGDVIPQVVQRVGQQDSSDDTNAEFISLDTPTTCPACGSETIVDIDSKTSAQGNGNATEGQILRCGGPQLLCPPRAVAALSHAYSRDAFDLTGLSEARIMQLMNADLLKIPSDVFSLANDQAKLDTISELDGWGPKSAQNVARVANRVASDGVSLSRFIYSLSIRYVGVHSSALLAAVYGNVDTFLNDVERAAKIGNGTGVEDNEQDSFAVLREETEATKGIGPVLLSSLEAFAMEKDLVKAARELARMVRVIDDTSQALLQSYDDDAAPSEAKPLFGMSVVFTGAMADLSRSEAKKLAVKMGAKSTPGTISKTTSLVVAGAKAGKKIDQATKLGVRVIDADEFEAMVKVFEDASTGLGSTKE
jgi:DNA ligase (NAD+)